MTVGTLPEPRKVSIALQGVFAGWTATARADFPAGWLADLQSGEIGKIVAVLDRIVLEHNFPGDDGQLAPSFADVPYDAMLAAATAVFDAIGKLPNR